MFLLYKSMIKLQFQLNEMILLNRICIKYIKLCVKYLLYKKYHKYQISISIESIATCPYINLGSFIPVSTSWMFPKGINSKKL